ncbi:phosphotransferase family protein [Alkalihalobacterium chitinilyticum]|uniref:Phosphotransferase family protein n=1 Tax=Alkalihalobacterium chitinilyticum TaxID=2980103 RepID=A0ABT5V8K3_9BACI|nr:phosphotransferase family protein [Alkalihalobacterium chitinilyticum]MDE5411789.1 phosphotransferase family protein [Alkalihalobacterium chitinilyticum]
MTEINNPMRTATSEIHWDKVESYIRREVPYLGKETMKSKAFSNGYSNLTYLVEIGDWQAVMRRPPFGPIPPRAHDMEREYRILEKIYPVFPLAPKPLLFCEDPKIMERHFYIMEKKSGVVLDHDLPEVYEKTERTGQLVSEAFVETLVKLHNIDIKATGLDTIGRPEGYLERQVHGWIKRYQNSKTEDIDNVTHIEKWLTENIPLSPAPTIVHNDFKLNNMMYCSEDPGKVVGVFDWEMCTIGDPMTDLGSAVAYWTAEGESFSGLPSVTGQPGFYSRKEILENYAQISGRDVSNFDFYLTFAFYKIAVILQQIYYRWKIGKANDERFETLIIGVRNLIENASRSQRKEFLK